MNNIQHKLDDPCNVQEKYLHGINVRLEALIHQVSTLVEYIASKDDVPMQGNTVDEHVSDETPKRKRK